MSKYVIARNALGAVLDDSSANRDVSTADALEALLVVTIEAFAKEVGRPQAAEALNYELSNLGGTVDTVFLRSR